MKRYVLYERKSKVAGKGVVSHTYATHEWLVDNFLKTQGKEGVDWVIEHRFAETYSGGGYYTKRREFSKAVELCKKDKGLTLLGAKPERLARNLRSATELMETINMTIAIIPHASKSELHMHFLFAEMEWEKTSERYTDMHRALKAKGVKVGAAAAKYKVVNRDVANRAKNSVAIEHAEKYRDRIEMLLSSSTPLDKMASQFKKLGLKTSRDCYYTSNSMKNLCNHLGWMYSKEEKVWVNKGLI